MKILHLPESFFPFSLGGKEVYCLNMMRRFSEEGHDNIVLIHHPTDDTANYWTEYEGFRIKVLPKINVENQKINWYSSLLNSRDELDLFEQFLKTENPDKVVFHDQNGGASLTHFRIAKRFEKLQIGLVFHSPGQMCVNRQLLKNLDSFCQIKLNASDCIKCKLRSLNGLSEAKASFLSKIPAAHFKIPFIQKYFYTPKFLSQVYINSVSEFYTGADQIYYHADWVKEHLLKNDVATEKLVYWSLTDVLKIDIKPVKKRVNNVVQLALIGRPTWIKGFHLLVEAIEKLPKDLPIKIHVLGKGWDESDYGKELIKRIASDSRFLMPKEIENSKMKDYLEQIDLIVVPSIWPETGPISVLDALSAGVNVLGANLAGIKEQSQKYDFPTFEWNDAEDLRKKIVGFLTMNSYNEK